MPLYSLYKRVKYKVLIMRRRNDDPNKGVAFILHLVAAYQKLEKKFFVSNLNEIFLYHMVPTSVHGAAFRDKQNQLFNL